MISDIAQIFPFGHIHLGADELPPNAWAGSPRVAALMKDENLANSNDVMGWMMNRVANIAKKYGLRPAAWEEAQYGVNGGIGHDAILFSWTGQAPGIAAARAGYDIVMCPAQTTYFDMAHSKDQKDWGATWAACFGLNDATMWDPIPEPDIAQRVIGVQCTYWGEFTTSDAQFEPMIAPRILGLATVAWARDDRRRVCDIYALADAYEPVFSALDWNAYKNVP
jgi:hexosaminidase